MSEPTKVKESAGEHTPGPWHIGYSDGSGSGEDGEGAYILSANDEIRIVVGGRDDWGCAMGVESKANARRIVACVNYCEGVTTRRLENEFSISLKQLESEHNAMRENLAFLERFADAPDMKTGKTTRDHLRERVAEVEDILRSMTNGLADHLKAGTVRCDSCASEVEQARAILAKERP